MNGHDRGRSITKSRLDELNTAAENEEDGSRRTRRDAAVSQPVMIRIQAPKAHCSQFNHQPLLATPSESKLLVGPSQLESPHKSCDICC
jgi:hypothetical protein